VYGRGGGVGGGREEGPSLDDPRWTKAGKERDSPLRRNPASLVAGVRLPSLAMRSDEDLEAGRRQKAGEGDEF
jgi:hypothetical protein